MRVLFLIAVILLQSQCGNCAGILYPRDSESRQTKFLDGVWNFRADNSPTRNEGFDQMWWAKSLTETGPVIDMPVPSSYNDVTEDKSLRDFLGWVWYERNFYVSPAWASQRVVLRIDSAHYNSIVWVNGAEVVRHEGGHLPFEAEVTRHLKYDDLNYVTVAINNTLTPTTLPPGYIVHRYDTTKYPAGFTYQHFQMDFFNYAGIHRHVRLYTTPKVYIDDITILTDVQKDTGHVNYAIDVKGGQPKAVDVSVLDVSKHVVATSSNLTDTLIIPFPHLWWPFGLNSSVGYMYKLQIKVDGDVYRQPFGIRTIKVTEDQFLINNKPFYCLGIGKHEDADLRGKGLDYTVITKDFNLLRWLGVNCIRTSHYPYAEEIMQFADRQGVAVIDESPGVGIINENNYGNVSLAHHIDVMAELIQRDKNNPSVIMWSVANEPTSALEVSVPYLSAVLNYTKKTDPAHRPVTFACNERYNEDKVVRYVDVICFNRYYGWYEDTGFLEVVQLQLQREMAGFRKLYKKPIIVSEYGADTVPGLHMEPSLMFTEEFQVEYFREAHKAFDSARNSYLVGEMVWNFADFMTFQSVKRVVGNKKGILTRQRQPKTAAFVLRERYNAILHGENNTCEYDAAAKYGSKPHAYV